MAKLSKRELQEQRIQEARRRTRNRRIITIGSAAIIIAAILIGSYVYSVTHPAPGQAMPQHANAHDHIELPTDPHPPYNSFPPTSGPHTGYLAPWGFSEVVQPFEELVHNLEDAGVVIYYNQQIDPTILDKLKAIINSYNGYLVLTPNPDNTQAMIILTAWNRIDELDAFEEERIIDFIEAYRGIDHHYD